MSRKRKCSLLHKEGLPCKLFKTDKGYGHTTYKPQSITALFQGNLAFQTRCFDCEEYTRRTEPFLHVSVPVTSQGLPGFPYEHSLNTNNCSAAAVSLSWCLSKLMAQERLTLTNKYWCDCCGHLVEAERSILFSKLPPLFIIHLNRFSVKDWGRTVAKVSGNVAVPLSLCLSSWTTQDCKDRNLSYTLQAVILHTGISCHSGHYTTMVQTAEHWLLCDDENVTVLSDTSVLELLSPLSMSSVSPYILFYSRLLNK